MDKIYYKIAAFIGVMTAGVVLVAEINFGSSDSCIMIEEGILNLGSASLSGGMLRDTTSGTGIIANGIDCTRMTFEINDPVKTELDAEVTRLALDGTIFLGGEGYGTIVLEAGESLTVSGASVYQSIYINGSVEAPSILRGTGFVNQGITVSDTKHGVIYWNGALTTNIGLNAAAESHTSSITLGSDLVFAPFCMTTALDTEGGLNRVYFNSYKLYFGGTENDPTIIYNTHDWDNANVQLTGSVFLTNAKHIKMNGNSYINGGGHCWTFGTGSYLDLHDSTLTCGNIVFKEYGGDCLQDGAIRGENVTFEHSDGRSFTLRKGLFSGAYLDPFEGTLTIEDAEMTLNTDMAINGTWLIATDTTIEGNGCHINLQRGTLSIAGDAVLTVRNAVLDAVNSDSLSGTGTFNLAHVTVVVDFQHEEAVIDWEAKAVIEIDGPVTFVTGSKLFSAAEGSVINQVTAYYDTLGASDDVNVTGFTGTGRLQWVDAVPVSVNGSFTLLGSARMQESLYLYPDVVGTSGFTITFDRASGGVIQYDGRGRSLFFPRTNPDLLGAGESEAVLFVTSGTRVYTTNMTIDGFKTAHVDLANTDTSLFAFGDNTLVVLHEDLVGDAAPDRELVFGKANAASQDMILNLNGHAIDLSHPSAAIILNGQSSSRLRIQNGRLLNVSDSRLYASHGNTIILDSVDMMLGADAAITNAGIRIEGHSSVYGRAGAVLSLTPAAGASFAIARDASFAICDGITYEHISTSASDFVFEDATAELVLIGGSFKRTDEGESDQLVLTVGHLVVDHRSYIDAGNAGIAFGDGASSGQNLNIDFRPGGTITLIGGTLAYNNVSEG